MRLREISLSHGLSVAKLAGVSGLHRRTLQNIEARGDCMVSAAKTLARALNVSLEELCKEEGK